MSELVSEMANFARFSPIHMIFKKSEEDYASFSGLNIMDEEEEGKSNILDFGRSFDSNECSDTFDSILCNAKDRSDVLYTYINNISDSSDIPEILVNSLSGKTDIYKEVEQVFEELQCGGKVSLEQLRFAMIENGFSKKFKNFCAGDFPSKGWMSLEELKGYLRLE